MECASACTLTCSNYNTPQACPDVCIVNGCQCPYGTVIDEVTNSCIPPSECSPGTGTGVYCVNNHDEMCALLQLLHLQLLMKHVCMKCIVSFVILTFNVIQVT